MRSLYDVAPGAAVDGSPLDVFLFTSYVPAL